ncbi:MAG: two-component system response regulator CreB [Methylococcaceae bacterium]
MAQRILVIEDEPAIAETTLYALGTEGFEAVWAATGQAAVDLLQNQPFDLAILDVGLPDINGFDLFRQIGHQLPVIFLTARSGEIDRIVGLELGADDYIAKPFSPRELCARVRTVLRRLNKQQAVSLTPTANPLTGAFQVDEERKRICFLGVALELSRTEYRLLKVLINKPGRVFTREELMAKAWEHSDVSLERTVDTHIKMIRAKLRSIRAEPDPIITHRGLGYALRE